jgi:hypothetical protein
LDLFSFPGFWHSGLISWESCFQSWSTSLQSLALGGREGEVGGAMSLLLSHTCSVPEAHGGSCLGLTECE